MASIFTKIVEGEIPCYKIAETDEFLAFLDVNPNAIGHTLCIPKQEVDKIFDMDEASYTGLMQFSRQVAKAIEKAIPGLLDVRGYTFPVLEIREDTPLDVVADIFEGMNRRGQPLNKFDLMVARLYKRQADGTYFNRREFCFTLDGDVFVRYQSFKNGQELRSAIQKRVPSKIDIGPVYNVDPQKRAAYSNAGGGFTPQERELVFDIDLTDYDDVRN